MYIELHKTLADAKTWEDFLKDSNNGKLGLIKDEFGNVISQNNGLHPIKRIETAYDENKNTLTLVSYKSPVAGPEHPNTEPVTIGHVYIAKGPTEDNPNAIYVGSTGQELKRRFSGHHFEEFITAETTEIYTIEVKAVLNVSASGRKTLRSARNEALRVPEQKVIDKYHQSYEKEDFKNRRGAATKTNSKVWESRHSVTEGEEILVMKGRVIVGAFAAFVLLDMFMMLQEQKRSKYLYEPYLLEDEGGVFTLTEEAGVSPFVEHHRWKNYKSGPMVGKTIEIDKDDFEYWKEEVHALWGYVDFWGNFVPGILRPTLPVMEVTPNDEL